MSAARPMGLDAIEALAPDAMSAAVSRLRAKAWAPIAFKLSLSGPTPDRLRAAPRDYRAGDPVKGDELYRGCFALAGATLHAPRSGPWAEGGPSSIIFREELEGFTWLRHLGAVDRLIPAGVIEARETARAFSESWIGTHHAFSEPAWAPAVVGRRLLSWLTESVLLGDGADLLWRTRFLTSLAQQARYLSATMELAPAGLPRLTAIMGVVLGCLALGDSGPRRTRAIQSLLAELNGQILFDGGHRSRSPAVQAGILCDLLTLKDAFRQSNTPIPRALSDAIHRMVPPLALFDTGNGQLAAFHGSGLENVATVQALLAGNGETPASLRDMGFERLEAGQTLAIVDAGAAPPFGYAASAHASALAFELVSGGQRVVVNCGRPMQDDSESRVFRTAAAHSTLSFLTRTAANSNRAKLQARLTGGPRDVNAARQDTEDGVFLETSHEGYAAELGRRHVRTLYLQDGDLRGEDRIEPVEGASAMPTIPFRLRFHLHPDIEAKMEEGGARLSLPSGELWRFRCRGHEMSIADSIFNGPDGGRAAKQLVIKGDSTLDPVKVVWAFRREREAQQTTSVE